MTTKNCANGPKLVLKDLCEKSFVRNVLYSPPEKGNAEEVSIINQFVVTTR